MVAINEQLSRLDGNKTSATEALARFREADDQRVLALEHAIAVAMSAFDAIAAAALSTQQLQEPQRERVASEIMDHYRWWLKEAEEELGAIQSLEKSGRSVNGAEPFKHTVAEVTLYVRECERLRRAARDLDEGKGIPLEEALSELRRRHVSGGA